MTTIHAPAQYGGASNAAKLDALFAQWSEASNIDERNGYQPDEMADTEAMYQKYEDAALEFECDALMNSSDYPCVAPSPRTGRRWPQLIGALNAIERSITGEAMYHALASGLKARRYDALVNAAWREYAFTPQHNLSLVIEEAVATVRGAKIGGWVVA